MLVGIAAECYSPDVGIGMLGDHPPRLRWWGSALSVFLPLSLPLSLASHILYSLLSLLNHEDAEMTQDEP